VKYKVSVKSSVPKRNASMTAKTIDTTMKMVRSAAGSPVVMWMFSFSRAWRSPSLCMLRDAVLGDLERYPSQTLTRTL